MTNRQESIQWSRDEIIWLAGLFEGEGCISFNKVNSQWKLTVVSTDEDVIASILRAAQVGNVTGPHVRGHKPFWVWQVGGRGEVYALLVAMWPWLHARRRERACECLLSISSRRTYERTTCRNGHDITLPDALITHWIHPRCRACAEDAVARKRDQRLQKRQTVTV